METFPEEWFLQHLSGPLAVRGVIYMSCRTVASTTTHENDSSDDASAKKEVFQCWLCATKGELKSPQSCLEHCRGRRHQRNYAFLERQQLAWLEDQLVIQSPNNNGNEEAEDHDDEDDLLGYFMPFRRWHFGKWDVGLSCQLCGTAAFPNRFAIVEHCESSRRHAVLRSRTLHSKEYHPEINHNNSHEAVNNNIWDRIEKLPYQYYGWRVERELLRYLAAKEASIASLASRRYAWYRVWKTLETFEIRHRLSLLECAIWKQHMLQYSPENSFRSLSELEDFFTSGRRDNSDGIVEYQRYRKERRKTSQSTGILLGVLPFLKEEPKIKHCSE